MGGAQLYRCIREHAAVIGVILGCLSLIVSIVSLLSLSIFAWYKDSDGDGYGDPKQWLLATQGPNGFVKNGNDCYDGNKDAKPGQTSFFDKDRGDGSFDYDCNDVAEGKIKYLGHCINETASQGWIGKVPDGGQKGDWLEDCTEETPGVPGSIKIIMIGKEKIQKGR